MEDRDNIGETETEQDTDSWVIRFNGYIEIKGMHGSMPSGYPLDRRLLKVISEEIAKYPDKYKLCDYQFIISDFEEEIGSESDG
jgi:hypothetical protein